MTNRVRGNTSIAYVGTEASNPPNWSYVKRSPTTADSQNYVLGDLWLNTVSNQAYMLISLEGSRGSQIPVVATWIPISMSTSGNEGLQGNTGGSVFGTMSNVIDLVGDGTTINIAGNPSTSTLTMSFLGTNTILTLQGDTGGPVGPSVHTIDLLGTTGHISTTGIPLTNTITLNASGLFTSTFDADAGSAVPVANILNVHGANGVTTTGSSNIITPSVTSIPSLTNLTVQNLTVTNTETFGNLGQGVVQSSSSGVLSSTEGTDGQLLIGSSAGAPAWATITAGANISIANGSNSIIISEGSGGSNGLTLISNGSQVYTGIPTTYKTLLLFGNAIVEQAGGSGGSYTTLYVTLSSNNGSSYYTSYLSGLNILNTNGPASNINFNTTNGLLCGYIYNPSAGLNEVLSFAMYIYNANSTTSPIMSSTSITDLQATTRNFQGQASGICTSTVTSPINALQIVHSQAPTGLVTFSTTLYGING